MSAYLAFPRLSEVLRTNTVCDQYDAFNVWKVSDCPNKVQQIEQSVRDLIDGTNKDRTDRFREIVSNVNKAADELAQKMELDTKWNNGELTYEDIQEYYTGQSSYTGVKTLGDVQSYLRSQVEQSKLCTGKNEQCCNKMREDWTFCESLNGIGCVKNCGKARAIVTINQLITSFLWQLGLWEPYAAQGRGPVSSTLLELLNFGAQSSSQFVPWNWAQVTLSSPNEEITNKLVTAWRLQSDWDKNKEMFSPGYTSVTQLQRAAFTTPEVRYSDEGPCVPTDCRLDFKTEACRDEWAMVQKLLQTIIGPDLIGNVYKNKQQWMFNDSEDINGLNRFSRSVMFLFVVLLPFINVGYDQKVDNEQESTVTIETCNKNVTCPDPPIKPLNEYVCGVSDKDVHPVFLIPFKEFYKLDSNEKNESIVNLLPSLKEITGENKENYLKTNGFATVFVNTAQF